MFIHLKLKRNSMSNAHLRFFVSLFQRKNHILNQHAAVKVFHLKLKRNSRSNAYLSLAGLFKRLNDCSSTRLQLRRGVDVAISVTRPSSLVSAHFETRLSVSSTL